jgi:membrane protease subunit HflC
MALSRMLAVVVAIGLLVAWTSFFIIDPRQLAIKFQLGEIIGSEFAPGLHFMKPLFINNVRKFDKRLLTLDTRPERFLTGEKKNVLVDFFVKWRIKDPATYYTAFGGDERLAATRLLQIINNRLQLEFDHRTIVQLVSSERSELMTSLTTKGNEEVAQFGVEIVDVRLKQIELPEDVRNSVFERMRAERERIAREHRAQGEETAKGIRAVAERERTVILADAQRDAETIRGEGDARATDIYAEAYGQDPGFFEFYRSMNAYREALGSKQDILLLRPDSEFFQFFNSNAGGNRKP